MDIARHRHERWDGRGYPDGLKEDELSLWARIVFLPQYQGELLKKEPHVNA